MKTQYRFKTVLYFYKTKQFKSGRNPCCRRVHRCKLKWHMKSYLQKALSTGYYIAAASFFLVKATMLLLRFNDPNTAVYALQHLEIYFQIIIK